MIEYCVLDDKGWVKEINGGAIVPSGGITIGSSDLAHKLKLCQLIMFWDGNQFCQVKNPKDIWKRVRINGFNGYVAATEYKNLAGLLDPSLPSVPAGTGYDSYPYVKKTYTPDFECELKPGLKVELSTEDDIDLWEKAMIDSGLYTLEEALFSAQSWLTDPIVWPVKMTWKGKPLQLELHQLSMSNTMIGGFTAHLDRSRPRWFWKQTALPVLKSLYGHGFEFVNEQVRADKPHYAQFLSDTYGHEILRKGDKFISLRLSIKEAISRIGTWPVRRTLGADWKWEKDGILIREATEADIHTIQTGIRASWGNDDTHAANALQILDERWNLDQASILIAYENGKMIDVRTYRERTDSSMSYVSTLTKSPLKQDLTDKEVILTGYLEWQKAAGYKTSTFRVLTPLYYKDTFSRRGWTVQKEEYGFTEARLNIEEVLNANK